MKRKSDNERNAFGKTVMVCDVAASEAGALSVLRDFHRQVSEHADKSIRWIFLVSLPELEESENVIVMRYPWIKKSWFHRIFFDLCCTPRLARRFKADTIFSLQEVLPPVRGPKTVVALMDCVPFIEYRFKLRESPRLWANQTILAWLKLRSMKRADKVILQIDWMKDICVERVKLSPEKIAVVTPHVSSKNVARYTDTPAARREFFYPATPLPYKNHMTVLRACKRLTDEGYDYHLTLTVSGQENEAAAALVKYARDNSLSVDFIGLVPREDVYLRLSRSVLIFASYVESYGVPLVEGMMTGSIILSTTCLFSMALLGEYPNKLLFDPFDDRMLAEQMRMCSGFEYRKDCVCTAIESDTTMEREVVSV